MASSRVGLRIRTFTALVRGTAARASINGMENARVLPVPVCAVATTARPSMSGGMACAWTGVGVTNSFLTRLFRNAEQRLSSEKCCIKSVRSVTAPETLLVFSVAAIRTRTRPGGRFAGRTDVERIIRKLPGYSIRAGWPLRISLAPMESIDCLLTETYIEDSGNRLRYQSFSCWTTGSSHLRTGHLPQLAQSSFARPRSFLEEDRCDFAVSRRTLEPSVGREGRRVFGTTSARALSSFSRARTSAQLASCVRCTRDVMINTPSCVARLPANASRRR